MEGPQKIMLDLLEPLLLNASFKRLNCIHTVQEIIAKSISIRSWLTTQLLIQEHRSTEVCWTGVQQVRVLNIFQMD